MTRYCALAYSAHGVPSADIVFAILAELRSGAWKLLVRSGWPAIVLIDDQSYVREMLADMKSRVSEDVEELFQQLSSLSVGPIITYAVGQDAQSDPKLAVMVRDFIEI